MGSRHQDTSDGFASIHDGYAYQKLEGRLTDPLKRKAYITGSDNTQIIS